MDIERIPPSPLPATLRTLSRLPREVVHQILDDLPLIKGLQILSHNNEFLVGCILSHLKYQDMFPSAEQAATTTEYFILHRDICRFRRQALSGPTSPNGDSYLSHNISMLTHPVRNFDLKLHLINQLQASLTVTQLQQEILSPFASEPYQVLVGYQIGDVRARWEWIKGATLNINETKAKQRFLIADLLTEYPGKVMLKKPLDPSQAGPRPNTAHTVNWFRGSANRILRNRSFPQYRDPDRRCARGVDSIELVPYDRYLWLFMSAMAKFPPATVELDLPEQLQSMSLNENQPYQYPKEIATSIKVVQDGLIYVYTGSPLLVVPRIRWKSTIIGAFEGQRPVFFIHTGGHAYDLPNNVHRCVAGRVKPHDEREYEWLKAFLKVVTWIEEHLDIPADVDGI